MPNPGFENTISKKKNFGFPPSIEASFFQQNLAGRVWLRRTGLAFFLFLNLSLQFYIFKRFSLIMIPFFVTLSSLAACYIIDGQARMVLLKSSLLKQMKGETQKKENMKNDEIIRTNNSLMLEILAHAEAEAQLRESEEKYRNLVTSLPEGIFIVQERKIVFVNPGMERLTGYDSDELTGKEADFFFSKHPAGDSGIDSMSMDFFIRQDGQNIFIEKSYVEILYGSKPALLFSVRDVTDKITATLEKNRLKKELEKAKKMEAFGILAGGVAHDLNNVLSGFSSIPDLILMDLPKDSHLIEQVNLIKDSSRKATSIADELLILARGSQKTREPVQFNYLIEDYLDSLEFTELIKNYPGVEIIKKLFLDLPLISASKIHMEKIIMNLVSNAVEAIGRKNGKVTLETGLAVFHHQRIKGYEIIEDGRFLRFSVTDTGRGISKEEMDHIFEPFYSKKVLGRSGTGLGLSIIWNAVHEHKGYIHVSSQKGRTFFTLYFPLPDKIENADMMSDSPSLYTLSDYSGNNETILVVDDMPSQQKIAVNMLRRLGYKAWAVSTGEEAISYAKAHKIDLAVLDMQLSFGLNGCETYEQLLLIDPKIKAIIMSGQKMNPEIEKAKALGAGDFIKKPISLQTLGLAIKKEFSDREKTS
ncbi:MAG: ATP-binding protein [Desulfobacula sp.]|jgi:PAS domain S-box-containing protein